MINKYLQENGEYIIEIIPFPYDGYTFLALTNFGRLFRYRITPPDAQKWYEIQMPNFSKD